MPHSHHSHSGQFCKHASGKLEEVVQEAIRQKFQVFGLTEHVPRYRIDDLYPEESDMTLDDLMNQFEAFLAEAHRLKDLYASQITLLVGLETEHITEADLAGLDRILERFGDQVEYIVGSVHHVDGVPIDFDLPTYEKALGNFAPSTSSDAADDQRTTYAKFYSAYFDAQYQLLERFKPEVVGHFDLCRLFAPSMRFADFPDVWEKIIRNIKFSVSYGALFELNAAAFRKKWDTAYPGEDIIRVILGHGGRLALSDDSHGPHAVGLNYHRAYDYLKSVGVSELWYLTRSDEQNAGGRKVKPVKLEGKWEEHSFWSGIKNKVCRFSLPTRYS
ncbi:histidinol-phosphatase [Coprinopsis cinerea okayama7|uniref:Histidinol-phosphatase n=1 Tax=Coprinopsis cinerea (strain Okayama-7 / 130 / ATCC MYA-4618 / FGSC 9003) TaxID=240176 RepID=A8NZG4_COPC7|nr:histidinol-phosphatase [Coprinopsis cinerea okayama7\|eukprot:XP_001837673.2 histidinol-phosphatase [Coprinopsis cinerea okayama7\